MSDIPDDDDNDHDFLVQASKINQTINSNINGSIGFSRAIYFTIGLLLGKGDDEF